MFLCVPFIFDSATFSIHLFLEIAELDELEKVVELDYVVKLV